MLLQATGAAGSAFDWDVPAVVIAAVALVVSIIVARIQSGIAQKQNELAQKQNDLTQKQNDLAQEQNGLTETISRTDRLLAQRQMFVTLWPYISSLDEVDPKQPIEAAVIKAVNALELVAICWEAKVVDHRLIDRAFGDSFIAMYDQIDQVQEVRKGVTGRQMLRAAPAISNVYDELRRERERNRAVPPLEESAAAAKR